MYDLLSIWRITIELDRNSIKAAYLHVIKQAKHIIKKYLYFGFQKFWEIFKVCYNLFVLNLRLILLKEDLF